MWQNLLDWHDHRVQVLRHFPTKEVVWSHPCDAGRLSQWYWYHVNNNKKALKSTILLFCSFQGFKINTHVRCRGPILHRGNIWPPFSAASPPSAGRPGRARRPAWSQSRALRGRNEPRSPPPRTPPGSTGGPDGTHPAREPRHSGNTNTTVITQSKGVFYTWEDTEYTLKKRNTEIKTLLIEIESLVWDLVSFSVSWSHKCFIQKYTDPLLK